MQGTRSTSTVGPSKFGGVIGSGGVGAGVVGGGGLLATGVVGGGVAGWVAVPTDMKGAGAGVRARAGAKRTLGYRATEAESEGKPCPREKGGPRGASK